MFIETAWEFSLSGLGTSILETRIIPQKG